LQSGERVRFVVIVKKHPRVIAKAADASEFIDVENIVNARRVEAKKFTYHIPTSSFFDMPAKLLVDPANSANIAVKNRREFAPAGADGIDVFARGARDREDFLDAAVGILAAVAFSSCQPFELHCREQRVAIE
jgi:hypothetical protein